MTILWKSVLPCGLFLFLWGTTIIISQVLHCTLLQYLLRQWNHNRIYAVSPARNKAIADRTVDDRNACLAILGLIVPVRYRNYNCQRAGRVVLIVTMKLPRTNRLLDFNSSFRNFTTQKKNSMRIVIARKESLISIIKSPFQVRKCWHLR